MRHIGFTGTRHGMTTQQHRSVDLVLSDLIDSEELVVAVHHGDCIGADDQFNEIAGSFGCQFHIGHPPKDTKLRANCLGLNEMRDPKPYMVRNADIVAESDVMIACPYEAAEQSRGGTWATIRMARKASKPLAIVWPDGHVSYERWP